MKNDEKKVTEEAKTEKNSAPLTDEELAQVTGGMPSRLDITIEQADANEMDGHRIH